MQYIHTCSTLHLVATGLNIRALHLVATGLNIHALHLVTTGLNTRSLHLVATGLNIRAYIYIHVYSLMLIMVVSGNS